VHLVEVIIGMDLGEGVVARPLGRLDEVVARGRLGLPVRRAAGLGGMQLLYMSIQVLVREVVLLRFASGTET